MKIAVPVSAGPFRFAALLFTVGLVARLAPLLDFGGRVFRELPTEDGYLMLTIARNIALGKGMSVGDGLHPTNGTQPLLTLVSAGIFWLTGGDRKWGVLGVQCLAIALSCLATYALWVLLRRLLQAQPFGASAALLAAAAWFASPLTLVHSMNCLETGTYALVVILVALVFAESPNSEPLPVTRCSGIGVLLGVAFWTRNDAVFLVLAACLVHVGWSFLDAAKPLARRLFETLVFGAISVLVATPWLAFNYLRFGAIVPVSGRSEALEGSFAANLWRVPIAVFEYATLYLPIPGSLEQSPLVLLAGAVACLAVAAATARVIRSGGPRARAVAGLGAIYGGCLLAFYGLSFGAGYFFSRYLFPASPFVALLLAAVLSQVLARTDSLVQRAGLAATALALCVLAVALHVRLYLKGTKHMHFQVVDWVQANVPDDAWVAAPQTGTLGFFHDRTINLDGKVNPEAFAARKNEGETLGYVLRRPEIQYLADWQGIASWIKDPRMAAEFELLVDDPARNLAVLRRKAVTH